MMEFNNTDTLNSKLGPSLTLRGPRVHETTSWWLPPYVPYSREHRTRNHHIGGCHRSKCGGCHLTRGARIHTTLVLTAAGVHYPPLPRAQRARRPRRQGHPWSASQWQAPVHGRHERGLLRFRWLTLLEQGVLGRVGACGGRVGARGGVWWRVVAPGASG